MDNFFRPDNRLLAWSTGDFSLFGGQPDPAVTIGRPSGAVIADESAPTAAAGEHAQVQPDIGLTTLAAVETYDAHDLPPSRGSEDDANGPSAISTTDHVAETAFDDGAAVAPVSGGSTAPFLTAHPTTANDRAPDESRGGDGQHAIVSDIVGAQAFHIAGSSVSDDVSFAGAVAQAASVSALIHSATDAVGSATVEVGHTIAAAQADLGGALSGLDQATGAIGGLAGGAIDSLQGSVGDLADTLAGVEGGVGGLAHLADTAAHAPALDIDQAIFAGTDPGGGITTLVNMVQSSELFSIGQANAVPAAPDVSGSIVDDLVGDAAVIPPLLGEDATSESHHVIDLDALHGGL